MPRIENEYLDSIFYIYPNAHSAEVGERVGGCGFIATVRSKTFDKWLYMYAVTNRHVITETNTPTIRINTTQDNFDIIITDRNDWELHPCGDDVAIHSIELDIDKHKTFGFGYGIFTTPEIIEKHQLGPGDETFMIGRFINHEGIQRNTPTVRFGNISMMPYEPVAMPDGMKQEAFLVEVNSLPGYSGSPVLWEIPDFSRRPHSNKLSALRYRGLLGIDAGHLSYKGKVLDNLGNCHPDKLKVELNSGMAVIVPAWKIRELIDLDKFKRQRQTTDDLIRQIREKQSNSELDIETIKLSKEKEVGLTK